MQQHRSATPLPPATLEGWYASHQVLHLDWAQLNGMGAAAVDEAASGLSSLFTGWARPVGGGWTAGFQLVGGGGDLLVIHFRETLDAIGEALLDQKRSVLSSLAKTGYEFLSITEAGLYHATAEAAGEYLARSDAYEQAIREAAAAEAASPHVRTRLYPEVPEGMRYVSFYPMTKRRMGEDNWYVLPVDERSRLMRDHGMTGRRYAGRVFQIISGAVGLDEWEWGVTLFARDPLEFKRIVTEMRYDEASARYGEFGRFFTGIRMEAGDWARLLGRG